MEEIETQSLLLSKDLASCKSTQDREELIANYLKTAENDDNNVFLNFEEFEIENKWINSAPLNKTLIQGKVLLVDFFTYCCINCIHMLPFTHQLEKNHSTKEGLILIGVHSAKFPNEKDSMNIYDFLSQYNIQHPVVNDGDCEIWNKLSIKCWPTFLVVNPMGKVILSLPGESHCSTISTLIDGAISFYGSNGKMSSHELPPKPLPTKMQNRKADMMKFPSKLAISPSGENIAISDSGSHCIFVCSLLQRRVKFVVGSKEVGREDGLFQSCQFNLPQGIAWLNDHEIFVADCGNHLIRKINLIEGKVITIAGDGTLGSDKSGGKIGIEQEINSPWDLQLAGSPGNTEDQKSILYIAMAGIHQIWGFFVNKSSWLKGAEYESGVCISFVGSGNEENRNNSYPHKAGLAQPSGLTVDRSNGRLYVADSESSTIRKIDLRKGAVEGVVGGGFDPMDLFAFGDCDGKARNAKLQHPMGVVWDETRSRLFVADTFNNKVKIVEPSKKISMTLCGPQLVKEDTFTEFNISSEIQPVSLNHPTGLCLDNQREHLFIADSNNHRVMMLNLELGTFQQFVAESDVVDSPAETRLFKRHLAPDIRRVERDVTAIGCGSEINLTFNYINMELTKDAPSRWQLGAVCDGKYIRLQSGNFDDDQVAVTYNSSTSHLLRVAQKMETNMELCLESMLYVCSDAGVCSMKKFLVSIPLNISQALESDQSGCVLSIDVPC